MTFIDPRIPIGALVIGVAIGWFIGHTGRTDDMADLAALMTYRDGLSVVRAGDNTSVQYGTGAALQNGRLWTREGTGAVRMADLPDGFCEAYRRLEGLAVPPSAPSDCAPFAGREMLIVRAAP